MTTPDAMMLSPRSSNAQDFAEEHWNRAAAVLSARPSLMTPHILLLVLKNRPPPHVVEFMLSLNPRAADIPPKGPTALQVAVQHNASAAVCRILIKASPLALVATHIGQDPLTYAKIWRREETELLQLLSRPLSYWMSKSPFSLASSPTSTFIEKTQAELTAIDSPPESLPKTRHPSAAERNAGAKDEELDNIKTIARTIVRAQRRQGQALQGHKNHVETSLQDFSSWNAQERIKQLNELEKRHAQHFRVQLIALDMKEKAMMARVKSMERRMNKTLELSKQVRAIRERRQDVALQRLEQSVDTIRATTDRFQGDMGKRLEHVELKVEQEVRMNDYFRSDTRLQLDQLDVHARAESANVMTPIVYATPYIKEEDDSDEDLDSVVPLFPKPFGGKQARRRYPGQKRRRHLGLINF
jgi:hypothetical protein